VLEKKDERERLRSFKKPKGYQKYHDSYAILRYQSTTNKQTVLKKPTVAANEIHDF
jgi:hypothetical protein